MIPAQIQTTSFTGREGAGKVITVAGMIIVPREIRRIKSLAMYCIPGRFMGKTEVLGIQIIKSGQITNGVMKAKIIHE